ncbi:hypothetical protein CDAR_590321 [Caerostris darwini]|uniref:Uncharacterized protein n=1 Tax=Caerostris darwini TaxID=1538125 RepID=A0AAV4NNU0_9ARAC|nr:hypothetical protein CDAR_590321 [Caerostris darwini]
MNKAIHDKTFHEQISIKNIFGAISESSNIENTQQSAISTVSKPHPIMLALTSNYNLDLQNMHKLYPESTNKLAEDTSRSTQIQKMNTAPLRSSLHRKNMNSTSSSSEMRGHSK